MARQKLLSVIIPTHNRAEMLQKAVQSVLAQEYSNLEIIIIADNCQDNTAEVVQNFQDKRIQLIQTQENVGGGQARNLGMDRAKGEYIAFLDDDDEWLENKLQKQIEVLEQHPEVALVTCNSLWQKGKQQTIHYPPSEIDLNLLLYRNYIGSFSFVMTTKEYLTNLRVNQRLNSAQDWDLWIKILHENKSKALTVNAILVKYYDHDGVRISKTKTKWLNSFIQINRQNWRLYSISHKYYQSYYLNLKINDLQNTSFILKLKKAFKGLVFLYQSKHFTTHDILENFAPLFGQKARNQVLRIKNFLH